ncbi:GTP:AMP phosphotransferase, mitochondrial [Podochytrium sp. JEL0797]|nr:GTP:AMP phosphotransferase, mitochondrial [Podochytrium sp. JEL0797]
MRTVVFFGAPGSGKGTLAKRFSNHFDTTVLSSGDLLRNHVHKQTSFGKHIQHILASGSLVQDSLVEEMMYTEMKHLHGKNILLDGFPRTVDQAQWLCSSLTTFQRDTDAVVNLNVPESVILKRIEDRWVHASSGRTYNLSFNPPKVAGRDDVTGEELTKRADDDVDTFKVRIDKFRETTDPILEYYGGKGRLNSFTGETSDELFPQIRASLDPLFKKAK